MVSFKAVSFKQTPSSSSSSSPKDTKAESETRSIKTNQNGSLIMYILERLNQELLHPVEQMHSILFCLFFLLLKAFERKKKKKKDSKRRHSWYQHTNTHNCFHHTQHLWLQLLSWKTFDLHRFLNRSLWELRKSTDDVARALKERNPTTTYRDRAVCIVKTMERFCLWESLWKSIWSGRVCICVCVCVCVCVCPFF